MAMKLNLVEIYGRRIPVLEDFLRVERELESTLVFLGTDHGSMSPRSGLLPRWLPPSLVLTSVHSIPSLRGPHLGTDDRMALSRNPSNHRHPDLSWILVKSNRIFKKGKRTLIAVDAWVGRRRIGNRPGHLPDPSCSACTGYSL